MGREYIIGEQKGRPPVIDFNEINFFETDDVKKAKLEYWIAKKIGEALIAEYPRRQWEVRVDAEAGMCIIVCPSVSITKGYHLYLNHNIAELIVRAKRAAGEILERHNVSRAPQFNPDVLETLSRTVRDDVIALDAAPEPISKVDHAA